MNIGFVHLPDQPEVILWFHGQLQIVNSTAATHVGMVIWEWCCVIIATLYVYFVLHPYILLISTKSFLYLIIHQFVD